MCWQLVMLGLCNGENILMALLFLLKYTTFGVGEVQNMAVIFHHVHLA